MSRWMLRTFLNPSSAFKIFNRLLVVNIGVCLKKNTILTRNKLLALKGQHVMKVNLFSNSLLSNENNLIYSATTV